MADLIRPESSYHSSFLAAMAEFADEGRTGDHSMVGRDLADWAGTWDSAAGFAEYVRLTNADAEHVRHEGWVRCTNLWWVENGQYVGRIAVRHELNEELREIGGHIGYDVRRSRRREGHATAMLAAALPVAAGLGLDRVLVTCDEDNTASRLVIERNQGVLEDVRQGKLRYWIDVSPA